MLTGTSAYTNNAGNSDWAREQLVSAYFKSKEAEYIALLGMGMAGGSAGKRGTKTSNGTVKSKLSPISTKGEGATLKRTFKVGGIKVEINSEHGYRESGHRTGSVRNVGTMDEIESGILTDVQSAIKAGVKFPSSSKTIERTVQVNGSTVGYTAKEYDGIIRVSTYYPK
ncbi:hypothetical protein ACP8HI_02560 [Paenibacillus sp. FA6]|uniref:hypothetical protein n=1 Tax=Paenibacillus sp. FA6 TaxID=3413029 RepID=UPI003F654B9B